MITNEEILLIIFYQNRLSLIDDIDEIIAKSILYNSVKLN